MLPIAAFETRFRDILSELDELAEGLGDEDLEEANAEFEDALFMLSQIDPRDEDAEEELEDTLDEFEALCDNYARFEGAGDAAARLRALVALARGNL